MDRKEKWRKRARQLLAEAFGGKCTICGYDRLISALDYHHISPDHKDDVLSAAMKNGHAWSRIVEEAKKCTIVCCRCHRELHAGLVKLPVNYACFNEDYTQIIQSKKLAMSPCGICGEPKPAYRKTCSEACRQRQQQKFTASEEELRLLVQENGYEATGRQFGVTGAAVKKRLRRFDSGMPHSTFHVPSS